MCGWKNGRVDVFIFQTDLAFLPSDVSPRLVKNLIAAPEPPLQTPALCSLRRSSLVRSFRLLLCSPMPLSLHWARLAESLSACAELIAFVSFVSQVLAPLCAFSFFLQVLAGHLKSLPAPKPSSTALRCRAALLSHRRRAGRQAKRCSTGQIRHIHSPLCYSESSFSWAPASPTIP